MTTTITFRADPLPSQSAQKLYEQFNPWGRDEWRRGGPLNPRSKSDPTLPTEQDFERFAADPLALPVELRLFDLVFPRVVSEGLFDNSGTDRVTSDSIGVLIWNGTAWEKSYVLAGPYGWGHSGSHHFSARAHLLRFV